LDRRSSVSLPWLRAFRAPLLLLSPAVPTGRERCSFRRCPAGQRWDEVLRGRGSNSVFTFFQSRSSSAARMMTRAVEMP
jgi:hypothetical protein